MKTIPLYKAFALLQNCSAVVIENEVIHPSLENLNGEDHHEFLHLNWEDDEGYEFSADFHECSNYRVRYEGSSLWLTCTEEGQEVQITLLAPMDIKAALLKA